MQQGHLPLASICVPARQYSGCALPLQAFFYKRAQAFAAGVYAAFKGAGLGAFSDADQLTMSADFRSSVVLRGMGILKYSDALEAKVS